MGTGLIELGTTESGLGIRVFIHSADSVVPFGKVEQQPKKTCSRSEKEKRWNLELIGYVNHGGAEHVNNHSGNSRRVGQHLVEDSVLDMVLVLVDVIGEEFLYAAEVGWGVYTGKMDEFYATVGGCRK